MLRSLWAFFAHKFVLRPILCHFILFCIKIFTVYKETHGLNFRFIRDVFPIFQRNNAFENKSYIK